MSFAFRFRPAVTTLESREVPAAGLDDVFNAARYLADNPDVRTAGIAAEDHFRRFGDREGRNPGGFFDSRVYLDDNPDVRDAVERGLLRSGTQHFVNFGRFEGRSKPITPVGTITQTTTTFDGTTANSDDKKYFSFSIPTTRPVRVTLTKVSGDFAKLEIENAATSADVLELEPKEGPNTGTVTLTGGTTYLLRVRASDDAAATFRVTLTQL